MTLSDASSFTYYGIVWRSYTEIVGGTGLESRWADERLFGLDLERPWKQIGRSWKPKMAWQVEPGWWRNSELGLFLLEMIREIRYTKKSLFNKLMKHDNPSA